MMNQIFENHLPYMIGSALAALALVFAPRQTKWTNRLAVSILVVACLYPCGIVWLYTARNNMDESYGYLIGGILLAILLGLIGGALLLSWIVVYIVGIRRRKRSLEGLLGTSLTRRPRDQAVARRNKLKTMIACIAVFAAMSGIAFAGGESKDLKVVMAAVLSDQDGKTVDDLRVVLCVKNVGEKEISVLTRNLQFTLFDYTDKPKELSIDLSGQRRIDGAPIIPSVFDLSPVTLKKGEIAEIQLIYRDRKNLDKVVLIYDMRNDLARRFNTWDGIVRSDVVEVMKAKSNR